MEAIIRNVRDLKTGERRVLENVLGQQLQENQQVIIQVVTLGSEPAESKEADGIASSGKLPDWCNVCEGLTDQEISEVEEVILQRSNLPRPSG